MAAINGLVQTSAGAKDPTKSNVRTAPNSAASPFNPTGYQGYGNGTVAGQSSMLAGDTSGGPYRDNLATNVQGKWDVGTNGIFQDFSNDSDADVRELQRLQNETSAARAGVDHGVSFAKNQAQMDALKSRIGLKNQLGSAISSNPNQEMNAEQNIRDNANAALDAGVKNTRENFNNRGLLYSGMREGGEQNVRGSVASKMGSDIAGTKREFTNLADQQKEAYAAVGMAAQKERMDSANQAFDTVSRNNIARLQAYQQLGQGLGQAAGYMYGSRGTTTTNAPGTTSTGGDRFSVSPGNDYGRSLQPSSYDQIMGR